MHFASSVVAAALLAIAQAVDVQVVSVGKNPVNGKVGNMFWPSNIKAKAGTMVQFQFLDANHSATQSNFDNPCVPINAINSSIVGADSSYQPVAASATKKEIPTWTIMINDTSPLWFYCKQGTHCQGGMSLVINEDTKTNATRSLANYQKASVDAAGWGGDSAGDSGSGSGSDGASGSGNGSGGNGGNGGTTPGAATSTNKVSSSLLVVAGAALFML